MLIRFPGNSVQNSNQSVPKLLAGLLGIVLQPNTIVGLHCTAATLGIGGDREHQDEWGEMDEGRKLLTKDLRGASSNGGQRREVLGESPSVDTPSRGHGSDQSEKE